MIRKSKSLLCILTLIAGTLFGDQSIQIGSDVFFLAGKEENAESQLREYLIRGESFEKWSKLVAVREFRAINDPQAYIASMASEYRKKRPHMKFGLFKSNSGEEWVIDFLDYPDGPSRDFVEWNVFRAKKGSVGIVVNQFAIREYATTEGDDPMSRIGQIRQKHLKDVYTAGFEKNEAASSH